MSDLTALPIDLDAEAIFLDGSWYTKEDLARRIKGMLDQGDYAVARPSSALEQLTRALTDVRTLAFRAPKDLAEAIAQIATRSGVSVGQVLREAAMGMVIASRSEQGPAATAPPPERAPQPVSAAPEPAAAPGDDKPVELTNPKKTGDDSMNEHRWFKQ